MNTFIWVMNNTSAAKCALERSEEGGRREKRGRERGGREKGGREKGGREEGGGREKGWREEGGGRERGGRERGGRERGKRGGREGERKELEARQRVLSLSGEVSLAPKMIHTQNLPEKLLVNGRDSPEERGQDVTL